MRWSTNLNPWRCSSVALASFVLALLAPTATSEDLTKAQIEPQTQAQPQAQPATVKPPTLTPGADAKPDIAVMTAFLDRLMLVESGGRDDARNPRSTAVGPFQFIESTFLDVARRHFAAETAALPPAQILALRTNRVFARRAAEAFTLDNADILANNAVPTSSAHLRLAFLVGPGGAVRLLKAEPATPVITLLGANVVQANPFMAGMAVRDLVAWSERSISGNGANVATARIAARPEALRAATGPGSPIIVPKLAVAPPPCNTALASCRKWIATVGKRPIKQLAAIAPRRTTAR